MLEHEVKYFKEVCDAFGIDMKIHRPKEKYSRHGSFEISHQVENEYKIEIYKRKFEIPEAAHRFLDFVIDDIKDQQRKEQDGKKKRKAKKGQKEKGKKAKKKETKRQTNKEKGKGGKGKKRSNKR